MSYQPEESRDPYRGFNPAFVRKVWEKRRCQPRLIEEAKSEIAPPEDAPIKRPQALVEQYRAIEVRPLPGEKQPARDIIHRLADIHGISFGEIVGQRRDKSIVAIRHMAIRAVADARPDLSTPQIGRVFNRDHTSILHALSKTRGSRPTAYKGKDARQPEDRT